jgi:hypothetical protein
MPISLASTSAMRGAVVPIGYATSNGSVNIFSFNNIPQNYQDLFLVSYIRSADTTLGAAVSSSIYINGASVTANFSTTNLYGNGSSPFSSRFTTSTPSYGWQSIGSVPEAGQSGVSSNTFGCIEVNVLNYANSSTYKTGLMRYSGDTNGSGMTGMGVGLWAVTSPITTISIGTYGNIAAGSTATLYGIRTVGQ